MALTDLMDREDNRRLRVRPAVPVGLVVPADLAVREAPVVLGVQVVPADLAVRGGPAVPLPVRREVPVRRAVLGDRGVRVVREGRVVLADLAVHWVRVVQEALVALVAPEVLAVL